MVRICPAHFFVHMRVKYLILSCVFLVAIGLLADSASPGYLEGHVKILALSDVELAGATPSKFSGRNYAEYPLIVLSQSSKQQTVPVTVDQNGKYRVALRAGNYVLDVQDRRRKHLRATPQPFTIISNQTVHVDMVIDTGVR
jgi:hypothetical protein